MPSSATAVSWAVIVNNIAALEILMDCGYVKAGVLVAVGAGLRTASANAVLRAVGLGTGWENGGIRCLKDVLRGLRDGALWTALGKEL